HPSSSALSTLSLHDALPIWSCSSRSMIRRRDRPPAAHWKIERTTSARSSLTPHFLVARWYVKPYGGSPWGLPPAAAVRTRPSTVDRKSTRLNSSHLVISYAV